MLLEGFIGVLCQSLLLHVVLDIFHPNHNSFGRFLVKCQNFAPDLGEKYNQTKLEAGLAVYYYVFFYPIYTEEAPFNRPFGQGGTILLSICRGGTTLLSGFQRKFGDASDFRPKLCSLLVRLHVIILSRLYLEGWSSISIYFIGVVLQKEI